MFKFICLKEIEVLLVCFFSFLFFYWSRDYKANVEKLVGSFYFFCYRYDKGLFVLGIINFLDMVFSKYLKNIVGIKKNKNGVGMMSCLSG